MLLATVLACLPSFAAVLPQTDDGLPGTRLVGGGGRLPDAAYARFLELAGGPRARIVLIPTASATADDPKQVEATLARWRTDHPGIEISALHTRDRAQADDPEFCAPLRAATGVWLGGGAQERLAAAYVGTRVEQELHALLARGGVVGGTSAGAAVQTRTMIREGRNPPVLARGFDFVPGAIVDQHFLARDRLPRLRLALAATPGTFGIGIDEGTAVEVRGRTARVLGASRVLFVLPPGAGRAERIVEVVDGGEVDLITWQRAACARAGAAWPPAEFAPARIEAGALLLAGGGRVPDRALAAFVQLAGGARAKVVVVADDEGADEGSTPARLGRLGAEHVTVLACRPPGDDLRAKLDAATAVWLDALPAWRLVDAFEGEAFAGALRAVLARGGVVGGSAGGAAVLGELLLHGDPAGRDVWCEGYDRGFALLAGCAIDARAGASGRVAELRALLARVPAARCLGIEDGGAVVVRGSEAEALGDGAMWFPVGAETPPQQLAPGERIDLARGR